MRVDVGGCEGVKILEELGELLDIRRRGMDFGTEGFDEARVGRGTGQQTCSNCSSGSGDLPVRQGNQLDGELIQLDRGARVFDCIFVVSVLCRFERIGGTRHGCVGLMVAVVRVGALHPLQAVAVFPAAGAVV